MNVHLTTYGVIEITGCISLLQLQTHRLRVDHITFDSGHTCTFVQLRWFYFKRCFGADAQSNQKTQQGLSGQAIWLKIEEPPGISLLYI